MNLEHRLCYTTHMQRTKHILVVAPVAFAASRQKLRGIYRYAASKYDWDIVLVRSDNGLSDRFVKAAAHGAYDGIILSAPERAQSLASIACGQTPLVMMEQVDVPALRKRQKTMALYADNVAIGKMAAEHLCGLGSFRSFAYIPDEQGRPWSADRLRGFADQLKLRNLTVGVYDEKKEPLDDFLLRLNRPAAVFAAWDQLAADVIRTCHDNRLDIPADVAVLGVDDDDLICESVRPALSSILVDRVRMGYRAAEILNALMRHVRNVPKPTPCGPLRVISRESTQAISSATALAKRATVYIKENAIGGITPADIARHLHVSRRLLDLRYREAYGTTPAEAIRLRKLVDVKRLLKSSGLSDARIAARCGFKNVNALRNLFQKKTGTTMHTYAKRARRRS